MLLGRETERRAIEDVLDRARAGASATLVLVGEPGIGKSALLGHGAERAVDMQLLRARGVEAESQIPFASLLELLRPALGRLDAIPRPQAAALEAALALRPGGNHERFAVGAATLSLIAAHAEERPVAVFVDDAHWLDAPSAEAIRFALRRLLADPVAALVAVRAGEPSLVDGAELPTLSLAGLTEDDALHLLPALPASAVRRLAGDTGGNPLAMLELAGDPERVLLTPDGSPAPVPERISTAYRRRLEALEEPARRAVWLAAVSDADDTTVLERAARRLEIDVDRLAAAEAAGLLTLAGGRFAFRHPLARSAVYAAVPSETRRELHRALADTLPDRDSDRRAWHLAAAAVGSDETASAALEHAAIGSRGRSAFATAAAGFERAARLTGEVERRAALLRQAGAMAWQAGLALRAVALLDEARAATSDPRLRVAIDALSGRIAASRGPIMHGHAILVAAAEQADPEDAAVMLAEATTACFLAGDPALMLSTAEQADARLPPAAGPRSRFVVAAALGMAHMIGGDGAAGASALREAVAIAEGQPELADDPELLPWLVEAALFLRESDTGRPLISAALVRVRERAALGVLPFMLDLLARDRATSDRSSEAEAVYLEAIGLARETDQRVPLAFGLAGLAWLEARRGRAGECQAAAAEALELSAMLGTRLVEVWASAALGELELARGETAAAVAHFEHRRRLLSELEISDADLSPAPELVEALLRMGAREEAEARAGEFGVAAAGKGQPWSLARAARCRGLLADEDTMAREFDDALRLHGETVDAFETARTELVYGERLRRARSRRAARDLLRSALARFERLEAWPWSERARVELAATGETLRRRDPTSLDELTPQELQIGLLLAEGRTTREAAAALFISPKTVEYHLRHVYLKLGVHSRDELAAALR